MLSVFKRIMPTLSNWIIQEIERELIASEPEAQEIVNDEIQALIDKLQKYIKI